MESRVRAFPCSNPIVTLLVVDLKRASCIHHVRPDSSNGHGCKATNSRVGDLTKDDRSTKNLWRQQASNDHLPHRNNRLLLLRVSVNPMDGIVCCCSEDPLARSTTLTHTRVERKD